MTQRLLDYDPITGVSVSFEYDHASDTFKVGYHQDRDQIDRVLDSNKEVLNDPARHQRHAKAEWAHFACVPNLVQYEWLFKHGVNFWDPDHEKAWLKLLDDPDYAYCKRTSYRVR